MANVAENLTPERFAQLVRAGLPFNAVTGQELVGANLERLQRGMGVLGWDDPRFVTLEDAHANGWSVKEGSVRVQVLMRDPSSGGVQTVSLYNASSIDGIPSLEAMQEMTERDIGAISAKAAQFVAAAQEIESEANSAISIAPVEAIVRQMYVEEQRANFIGTAQDQDHYRVIEANYNDMAGVPKNALTADDLRDPVAADIAALRQIVDPQERFFAAATMGSMIEDQQGYKEELTRQAPDLVAEIDAAMLEDRRRQTEKEDRKLAEIASLGAEGEGPAAQRLGDGADAGINAGVTGNGYAILAPYWRNGLHNAAGVALAEELNKQIRDGKIARDKEAIERLMAIHPQAASLGLRVTTFEQYRDDPHLRADMARPRALMNGALVRDREGAYRPAAGGRPVLVDRGESVTLKSKDKQGYEAAMELALAKGWKAIELKGKPAMLADAWLEAKLKGLNVVNYVPNEMDTARYAERVAEESARRMALEQRGIEQMPEMVEVRPFIDAEGQLQQATVTYTVEREAIQHQDITTIKDSAKSPARFTATAQPSIVRTTTRAPGYAHSDLMAGGNVTQMRGQKQSVAKHVADEVAQAVKEVKEQERAIASLHHNAVDTGSHVGPIMRIDGNMVAQKTGRDPDKVTWHNLGKLDVREFKVGEMAEITYSKGVGKVKEQHQQERAKTESRGRER